MLLIEIHRRKGVEVVMRSERFGAGGALATHPLLRLFCLHGHVGEREQVIKHVYIDNRFDNRGGQAIFAGGDVSGGVPGGAERQPYGTAAISGNPALLGAHALGIGLSLSGDAREKALSPSWGSVAGGADGQSERELPTRREDEGGYGRAA